MIKMSRTPLRFYSLFTKYARNTYSESEWKEFWELMGQYGDDNLLDQEMKAWWHKEVEGKDPAAEVDSQKLFSKVLNKEKAYRLGRERLKTRRRHARLRWLAAATALLLVGSAGYFLFPHPKGMPPEATHSRDVRAPQSNRAVITLATGQKIGLDSLKNGLLALQGAVKVSKLGDGAIVYSHGRDKGSSGKTPYNTLSNPKGSKVISLTLEDGSRVWLNAASTITYPVTFAGDKREVSLNGEAYFEVKHHLGMSFIVTAGGERIEDIGTRFNINAYPDEPVVRTTLVKGAVKVSLLTKGLQSKDKERNAFLKPGQQAIVKAGGGQGDPIKVETVDVDDVIAWKEGRFRFSSVDIATIMRQAARWYDVDVLYQGKVKGTLSGGLPRSVNISGLLDMLELTGRVTFSIEGKKVIVRPVETN